MGVAKAEAGRYLSFILGDEAYAVPVERVEVVIETPVVTRVPNAAPHLRGVINHRGSVIPVLDPRLRFEGKPISLDDSPSVVVLQVRYDDEDVVVGMLADSVREVVDILDEHIKPAPAMGASALGGFVSGVAMVGGEFIVILDVDAAFCRSAELEAPSLP